jgi:flagellar hook assembly protein FlgD
VSAPAATPPRAGVPPRLPVLVFTLLVASTFAAFFVAQRLKHDPSPVQQYLQYPVFSPNGDGRFDAERINFKLRRADDVTIEVLDSRGDPVRKLVDARSLPAYRQTRFSWDGRTDDGARAPDGRYRMRITLRREGRSLVRPDSFVLDTTAPRVEVLSIGPKPAGAGRPIPKILPSVDGAAARIRFLSPGRKTTATVFRTDPGHLSRVDGPVPLPDGADVWSWAGTTAAGAPAAPGTYVVVITSRDVAGNIGTSVPLSRRTGLPVLTYGTAFAGRGGITIRRLGVLPPAIQTVGGALGAVSVDARSAPYRWSLRRVGGPRNAARRGGKRSPFLKLHAPPGVSRLFLLSVRANGMQQRVPYPVQSTTYVAGKSDAAPHGVLVVLPVMTWQGRNPVDDDGDGLPDLLDRGLPVRLSRVYAGNGLPSGFMDSEAPLMAYLDGHRHRYDLTTDVALATSPPDLNRYRGVLIAGDARWLPVAVGKALRSFVTAGGTVVSLGTDSLRRSVTLTPRGRLTDPTPPAATDLFGARLAPVEPNTQPIENSLDKIDLFRGGTGSFHGFPEVERTIGADAGGTLVASAVNAAGKPVVVANTLGKGLVVRTGLVGFASHLNADRNAAALMESMWLKLSR